ncbi:hypothetical protein GCM10009087_23700 [Sphingomonas oligophenolica]|uniref:Uncharacterized protein n=1 Tax=Sphingomonas oligophenolica TaxID=301154 RepID=A0ABU9Y1I9_9SPHN
MKPLVALLPLLPAFLLAGCNSADPGTASPAEAQQLNDAAAMLDANSVDINAVTPNSTDQEQPQ